MKENNQRTQEMLGYTMSRGQLLGSRERHTVSSLECSCCSHRALRLLDCQAARRQSRLCKATDQAQLGCSEDLTPSVSSSGRERGYETEFEWHSSACQGHSAVSYLEESAQPLLRSLFPFLRQCKSRKVVRGQLTWSRSLLTPTFFVQERRLEVTGRHAVGELGKNEDQSERKFSGSLRVLMAGQFSRGPLRGPLRGPSRGGAAVLIDRNYVVLPETPEAAERVSNVGAGTRHTYSSLTSGDFPYFTVGGPSGGPLKELGWSMCDKLPLWCESLIWWLLPILLFLFLFLLYSAGALLLPRAGREDYGIVIDAGSHGSRVNIFKWAARVYDPHNPLTGPVSLPRLSDFRVYEPGIERAFEDPEAGKAQLQQMIRDASASLAASGVSASRWGEVPIYLKATAGMRTLGQEKRDSIMRHVRDTFHDPGANPFHFKNDFARVISGEEEGVYGWVAVNSEKNLLGAPPEQTLGALDMGGSSSQITFSPFFTSILEDFNSVHLGNTSIQLYSHSFLGYGWADALTRINLKLAAAALISSAKNLNPKPSTGPKLVSPFRKLMEGGRAATAQVGRKQRLLSGPIEHPCFPIGHAFSFTLPQVNQEGLRLYVDLDADTLQALLQVAGVPAQGVKARHELQDAEGREEARRRRRGGLQRGEGAHRVSFSKGRGRRRSLKVEQQEQQQSSSPAEEGAPLQPKEQGARGSATAGATEVGAPGIPPKGGGAAERLEETFRMQKVKVKFSGAGDFEKCHHLATQLFFNFPCFINRCSFNGVYQPRLMDSKFLAFGQYAKVWSALQLPAAPRLSAWKEKTERICNMDQEALEVYRRQNDIASYSEKGMRRVCWKASWCYSLLVDGFGFDSENAQITFSAPRDEKLGGGGGGPMDSEAPGAPGATGWALGSMLIDVNLYPWGMTDRLEFFLYILGAVSVGLFVCLVGLLHLLRRTQAALRCLETEAAFAIQAAKFQSAPDFVPPSP
ncbi:hypothetical protein Emag_006187 [Eimeria magna]